MNKKGFSMMELITSVVILGLLSVVTIIVITRIISSGNENYYEQQKNQLLIAGKDYFTTHTDRLPKEIFEKRTVSLEELIEQNYIDPVRDSGGEVCNEKETIVTVRRNRKNEYEYQVYLFCDNYEDEIEILPPGNVTHINMTPYGTKDSPHMSNKNINIKVTIDGAEYYEYIVRNITTDSERTETNQSYGGEFYILLTEDGEYEVTVIGKAERAEEREIGYYIIDRTPPQCGATANLSWTNASSRTVSIPCIDDGLTPCARGSYSQTFTATANQNIPTGVITISDIVGNTRNCPVTVRIDRIPPTCGPRPNPAWTNALTRVLTIGCSDNAGGSGCVQSSFTQIFSAAVAEGNIAIRDNAGNVVQCTVPVRIDRTPPSCGIPPNPAWTNAASRALSIGCSDLGGSGCVHETFTETFTAEAIDGTIIIRDNAGNTRSCQIPVRIDRTPPNCVTRATPAWSNAASRNISVGCDNLGRSPCAASTFTQTFRNGANQVIRNGNITIRDQAGNTRNCSAAVRMDRIPPHVEFRVECGQCGDPGHRRRVVINYTDNESGLAQRTNIWWNTSASTNHSNIDLHYQGSRTAADCLGVLRDYQIRDVKGRICDVAGNCVNIDRKAPAQPSCQ